MALVALGRGELYTEDELKTLLAREISKRPWPTVGTVVSISHDWDGPSTYNSEEFLSLKSQDRVRVTEVSPLGAWLRGTVVGSNRNGWFGGPGCEAAMSVNLDIPLGSEMDEELPFAAFAKEEVAFDEDDGDLGDLEKDLEDYVARNHVDSSAATALKALSPEMQAEIIKNDMTNCRSPSAVLLSRIEKLKAQWPHTGAPGRPVAPTVAPRKAAASLALAPVPASRVLPSTAPAGVPQLRGSAARSRSPRGMPHPQGPRKESKENWEKGPDVEDFIERHQLDERAVGQLRSLAPEELQMIVNADLTNARNPSAVVLSRIQRIRDDSHRDAHRHAVEEYLSRNSVDEVAGGALKMLPMEVQQQIMQSDLSNSRNPSAVLLSRIRAAEASLGVPAGQPPPPGGGWGHGGGGHGHGSHGGHGGGSPPAPQGGWGGGGGGWGPNQMVEDFIQQYGLDEKVAVDLRMLPEQELQEVMSCNIRNARNPSAMVRSRIQAVQSKSKFLYMVEDYLGRYEVDEVAASALRNATQEVQTRVMEEEMVNCRNPSAVLISRIRAIEKGQR